MSMTYTQPSVERMQVVGRMLLPQSQCESAPGYVWLGNGICKITISDGDIEL
jgi:hypothetical protein